MAYLIAVASVVLTALLITPAKTSKLYYELLDFRVRIQMGNGLPPPPQSSMNNFYKHYYFKVESILQLFSFATLKRLFTNFSKLYSRLG